MKSSRISGIALVLIMIVSGALIFSAFKQPIAAAQDLGSSAVGGQVTATPGAADNSVIGSTDGIVLMGFLIVAIVIAPVLIRRKRK